MKHLYLLLPLFALACAQTPNQKQSLTEQNITIGQNLKANRYSNIYFSSQPSTEDIKTLKEQGFTHIVNLRPSSEYDEASERKTTKEVEMIYSQVPFKKSNSLTDPFISKVTKAVVKHRKKGKTLVHCGSGNRAALWVGGHFHKDHKYDKEASIEMAQKMGMTSEKMLEKLKVYLKNK